MFARSARGGLVAAWRRPGLTLVFWVWSLLLAGVVAYPVYCWLGQLTSYSLDADRLLTGLSVDVLTELTQYDRSSVWGMLWAGVLAVGFVALVGNAFFAGGIIDVLLTGEERRPFLHRFFRGAGRFFWRYLKLLVLAGVTIVIVGGAGYAAVAAAVSRLRDSASELLGLVASVLPLIVAGVVVAWSILSLDYARIAVARDDTRRTFRAWTAALRLVGRHLLSTCGLALVMVVLLGLAALVLLVPAGSLPTVTSVQILRMFALQQAFIIVRTWLRVGLLAGEVDLYQRLVPAPAPPVPHAVPASEPVVIEPAADAALHGDTADPPTTGSETL
jgi:hypothetical protein